MKRDRVFLISVMLLIGIIAILGFLKFSINGFSVYDGRDEDLALKGITGNSVFGNLLDDLFGNGENEEENVLLSSPTGCTIFVDKNIVPSSCTTYNEDTRSCPGGTEKAYKTIDGADSVAVAEDVVCVRAGTYTETITPINSGTANAKITFKAYPSEECQGTLGTKRANCQVILSTGSNKGAFVDGDYIRIEGFRFETSATNGGIFGIEVRGGRGIEIVNNEITGYTFNAIQFSGVRDSLVRNNYVHHTAEDPFHGGAVTNVTIEYNTFGTPDYARASALGTHADGLDFYGAGTTNGVIIR